MGRFAILVATCAVTLGACNVNNDGRNPPSGVLYYPMALALSPTDGGDAPKFLYVANANFDLRYNSGTLQSYDLDKINDAIADDCDGGKDCVVAKPTDVMVNEVRIGSQASAMAISPDGDRVFVGIRADGNLTTVNVDPATGNLACGNGGDFVPCDSVYEGVNQSQITKRNLTYKGDVVSILTGRVTDLGLDQDGNYLLVAHRNGRASLLFDRVDAPPADKPEDDDRMPVVVDILGGLPTYFYGMRLDASTGTAWMANSINGIFTGVSVALPSDPDRAATDTRLYATDTAVFSGINDASDTRDLVFDTLEDGSRKAYILSRTPEAVLVADVSEAQDGVLPIERVIETGYGPSKLELLKLTVDGAERSLLVVSCFSSRDLEFIDPVVGRVVAVLRGVVGPYAFTIDPVRQRIYVADFRASVLRVASYKPLAECLENGMSEGGCDPVVIGTVGLPNVQKDLL